jgi:BolA protein
MANDEQQSLKEQLQNRLGVFSPSVLEIVNESHGHGGYFEGKETQFKLTIVSEAFAGKRLVQRHQLVYGLIHALLSQGGGQIHAFSIHAYTQAEWQAVGQSPESPNCAGQNAG